MNLETNKIFAAVLIAGIFAYLAGFIANLIYPEDVLTEQAYVIDVPEVAATPADAGPVGPDPIDALLADADIAAGERLFRSCAACHTFEEGGAHGIGPNLWNVVGKAKGTKGGFAYSDALTNEGGIWDYEDLNQFLYNPKNALPGTKMNYIGMKRDANRVDIIAWLRSLSDSPHPLP